MASTALWLLAAITIGGLILRLVRLDADLWLDEITTILMYGRMPVLHVITSYIASNNHLLNTLLIKLTLTLFGEREWAVRLPAMFFGVATIPAIYWVSRLVLSRGGSLCAALLLATSYHHIFFSQNARGYTAYLFFSVLSCGLLVKGLQEDRARFWVLYVLTMFLNFASLLNSGFVFAAHMLVGVIALIVIKRSGASPLPLLRRLATVFALTGALFLNLYVTILPQAFVYSQNVYSNPANGFSPLAVEFWRELSRGLGAGFGTGLFLWAVPFLIVAAAGFVVLFRRQWPLMLALVLPGVLTASFLLAQRLTFSPRFFLLGLPLAIIVAVQGLFTVAAFVAERLHLGSGSLALKIAVIMVLIGGAISLASLPRYYATPKQPYRASLRYIEATRTSGEPIIAVYLMDNGYRFYGRQFGLQEGIDWFSVRSVEALDAVLSSHRHEPSVVVTTFPRALRLSHPDLYGRILAGWTEIQAFPATIGDGEISVWRQRTNN